MPAVTSTLDPHPYPNASLSAPSNTAQENILKEIQGLLVNYYKTDLGTVNDIKCNLNRKVKNMVIYRSTSGKQRCPIFFKIFIFLFIFLIFLMTL